MFSTKLSRTAHRATCAAINSSTAAARPPTCLAARRSHQRRHSSSKTSCPPDSSASGGKPAPATKASNGEGEQDKAHLSSPTSQQKGGKRVTRAKRSRSVGSADQAEDQFAGLPAVPGTPYLSHADLSVSSFFSLHRPLSLSSAIPPTASPETFSSIFESRKEVDPWENGNSAERRPEDNVYVLGSLFDNIDEAANESQDDEVRWEVIHESPSNHDGAVKHLDGPPRAKSIDELVAELSIKPFHPPPPPQAFPEEDPKTNTSKRKASKPKQQTYEMTLTLTENTSASGQTTYTASSSPMKRVGNPDELSTVMDIPAGKTPARFPFRERMLKRQSAFLLRTGRKYLATRNPTSAIRQAPSAKRAKMMLISVKRQRKLKMKKHKYKKLMKRTRNLRRRQDRA